MNLQPAENSLEAAVEATLGALDLKPEDLALSRLSSRYAREMDQSAAVAAQADKVLRVVGRNQDEDDDKLYEMVSALKSKLSARSAIEQIGPKLQNALDALGATPKARKALTDGSKGVPSGPSRLSAFREAKGA
jgi:hypothetical protein